MELPNGVSEPVDDTPWRTNGTPLRSHSRQLVTSLRIGKAQLTEFAWINEFCCSTSALMSRSVDIARFRGDQEVTVLNEHVQITRLKDTSDGVVKHPSVDYQNTKYRHHTNNQSFHTTQTGSQRPLFVNSSSIVFAWTQNSSIRLFIPTVNRSRSAG